MSIIAQNSDLGGLVYPFLVGQSWAVRTWKVNQDDPCESDGKVPTLRWVKDNKVCDLHIKDMDTEQFISSSGLSLNMERGAFTLSKRISRVMRPYRFWHFFSPEEITIEHDSDLSTATWDGCGLVSRELVLKLAENLDQSHPDYKHHLQELEQTNRFEVTVLHDGGQEKGHVLVSDDLATDFLFTEGSAKRELSLNARVFVGLAPIHARNDMRLDIQSLVNLYPFFQPEHLLAWLHQESELFLHSIREGSIDALLSRLGRFSSADDLSQFTSWWLAEYLVSGGSLMWFPGTIRAMARQHSNRIYSTARKYRFPIPGGHYYIFPAEIGERIVQPGQVELDPDTATAWVSTEDWNNFIVERLGGCDGDDGVWVCPFVNFADEKQILIWRSPNQLGEYVLLQPTSDCHELNNWPRMNASKLPPAIESVGYTYGELPRYEEAKATQYSIVGMDAAIRQVRDNRGVLGAYCNMLLLVKAIYGHLPTNLPARLEDVIDGSVKSARDLSPVMLWVNMAAHKIIDQHKPIPETLHGRITRSLSVKDQQSIIPDKNHWITTLLNATQTHIDMYKADVEALAADAEPPAELFTHRHWKSQGDVLRQQYARDIRHQCTPEAITHNAAAYLNIWNENQHLVLIGAALGAMLDAERSDAVLWHPGISEKTIMALRAIGLLGKPVWTREGAALWYDETIQTAVPIQLNAVWFNWLKAQGQHFDTMSDVPKQLRDHAKQRIAEFCNGRFTGVQLYTQITNDDRLTTHTEHGNLFAYVKPGQELRAARFPTWRINHAQAKDGNLLAVLTPA